MLPSLITSKELPPKNLVIRTIFCLCESNCSDNLLMSLCSVADESLLIADESLLVAGDPKSIGPAVNITGSRLVLLNRLSFSRMAHPFRECPILFANGPSSALLWRARCWDSSTWTKRRSIRCLVPSSRLLAFGVIVPVFFVTSGISVQPACTPGEPLRVASRAVVPGRVIDCPGRTRAALPGPTWAHATPWSPDGYKPPRFRSCRIGVS